MKTNLEIKIYRDDRCLKGNKVKSVISMTALLLAACGSDKVSFDTLELARKQAKENGEFKAQLT